MANKTTQAYKISASWTPHVEVATKMLKAAGIDAFGVSGGRLALKHAIAADYTNPEHAVRATERIAAYKVALAEIGELHSFSVSAGAVPDGEAEVLSTDAPKQGEDGGGEPESEPDRRSGRAARLRAAAAA